MDLHRSQRRDAIVRVAAIGLGVLVAACADDPVATPTGSAGSEASSGGASTTPDTAVSSDGTSGAGDDTPGTTEAPSDGDGSSTASADSGSTDTPLVLPTPCDDVAAVFVSEPSTEPNDTPEDATDLCTIDVVGSWHVAAEIGGDDLIDHFVFHAAGDTGVVPFLFDACFSAALELQLFQARDDGLVPLWSGSSTAPACEDPPPALPAGYDYLLVVTVPAGVEVAAETSYGW